MKPVDKILAQLAKQREMVNQFYCKGSALFEAILRNKKEEIIEERRCEYNNAVAELNKHKFEQIKPLQFNYEQA